MQCHDPTSVVQLWWLRLWLSWSIYSHCPGQGKKTNKQHFLNLVRRVWFSYSYHLLLIWLILEKLPATDGVWLKLRRFWKETASARRRAALMCPRATSEEVPWFWGFWSLSAKLCLETSSDSPLTSLNLLGFGDIMWLLLNRGAGKLTILSMDSRFFWGQPVWATAISTGNQSNLSTCMSCVEFGRHGCTCIICNSGAANAFWLKCYWAKSGIWFERLEEGLPWTLIKTTTQTVWYWVQRTVLHSKAMFTTCWRQVVAMQLKLPGPRFSRWSTAHGWGQWWSYHHYAQSVWCHAHHRHANVVKKAEEDLYSPFWGHGVAADGGPRFGPCNSLGSLQYQWGNHRPAILLWPRS